ncbi:Cyclohexanone 1,2-monooxygenase [Colletotrichum sp. SAR 10_70]|nr:Cyclohexanone 1,2-monooxygenase [Colletotrichum sp. SAR 10_71]KAI8191089.1 Cyclohexanone 1,2-monooxygenase [Colletotrichum sp. SAR 10_75]KAI8193095.1 Cyclohexanone 1,2-monooxygenase [Colletotrichum sp. SAR 10_70]KAI8193393.1 Cyclohexanone 1,2-monooxygenase [Colletotrichum sp. SAR 10_65]
MAKHQFDALIIGAGLGGIHSLYHLRAIGLSKLKLIDLASDVGGTWHFNTYPGAMSDTESYLYRFPWDKEDLMTYPWPNHYVTQPEILAYLRHVVLKHDLRRYMQFNTEMRSATFDETKNVWLVEVSTGETFEARYLVTALGLLSRPNLPDIPGTETFKGSIVHSHHWHADAEYRNKRVAVIGTGSTGTQIVTAVAPHAASLTVFQRTPQYSVPAGNKPVTAEYREHINQNYDDIWAQTRESSTAFGFQESTVPCMSVSPEDREKVFEKLWQQGNGFRFMFGGFGDITTNVEANEEACRFVRKKIAEIVKDPVKARKLTPTNRYARRPLCDSGYYEQFNRENVDVVNLRETEIVALTPKGILTSDDVELEVDLIVFATGFDAIDGSYTRLLIRGRNGRTMKDHWVGGAHSYMSVCCSHFPNMFMINGPQGPFCNIPSAVEASGELMLGVIKRAEEARKANGNGGSVAIEVKEEAEDEWGFKCEEVSEGSLFKETNSWIFGANIPGKPVASRFWFGGLKSYREQVAKSFSDNLSDFRII